jgi:hypothetical protein
VSFEVTIDIDEMVRVIERLKRRDQYAAFAEPSADAQADRDRWLVERLHEVSEEEVEEALRMGPSEAVPSDEELREQISAALRRARAIRSSTRAFDRDR